MARSIECECTYNFTCGYCLQNAKPWHFTPSDSRFPPSMLEDQKRADPVQVAIEEGLRIERATGSRDHYPVRYVVTHISQRGDMAGCRVLSFAAQGRNTYDTAELAQAWIEAARKNNSASTMAMYGVPDTLEVRAVQCYPGHHDPVRTVFECPETNRRRPISLRRSWTE